MEGHANKEATTGAKTPTEIKAVLPLSPFMVVSPSGAAEVVFMAPDGRIVGKDDKYNEEFAKKIEAQILRAKIAGAGSPGGFGSPK